MKNLFVSAIAMVLLTTVFAFAEVKGDGVTLIVTHEVKDYDTWRKGFDSDEANRSKAGFKLVNVFTSIDKPNEVTIIFEAPSVEAVNGMLSNPDLKVAMEKSGVISKPVAKILVRK